MRIKPALCGLALATLLASSPALAELIDTREFFRGAEVTNMKIAPDGEHVAFTYEDDSEVKLAVMNLESREVTAGFAFGDNMHVFTFWWGSDTRVVMNVGEVTGNLDNMGRPVRLYAADIDGRRREHIFGGGRSGYQVLHPLPDDPDHILITRYHMADQGEPKAHLLNIYRGETQYLAEHPPSSDVIALLPDNSGEIRIGIEFIEGDTFDDREFNLFAKHGEEWRRLELESRRSPVDITPLGFSADNSRGYFTSNHDMAENDRSGVFRYHFDTGEIEKLYRHPDVDVSGPILGHDGEVLGVTNRLGPVTYTFFDDKAQDNTDAVLLQRLALSFPDQNVSVTSYNRDGTRAIVSATGDRNPGDYFLFDTESMEASYLASRLPDLSTDNLVEMSVHRIEARDGLELHALLTRPEGEQENLPLIVNVHGGPFGITDFWGFQPEAQFFAQHGYATLQVNFRGSGNRGSDFQRLGRKEWGGKMQDDVTDATRWAIDQGIADADRVCIYGGSYGGYASLMGVIREPGLYQCAVGYVGVYDLPWFRDGDGNDWSRQQGRDARRTRERWMNAHVGEDADALEAVSPVHNVDKIEAELFIVHGGSDVRVVVGHAERLRAALNEIGKSHEWMLKEDEGHGFYDLDNRVELYESMLSFFERHIGADAER